MTGRTKPLNIKPMLFIVAEMVMSFCFSLFTALVTKLRTNNPSLLQCPSDMTSSLFLFGSASLSEFFKNLFSVIPIIAINSLTVPRHCLQRTLTMFYSSLAIVFSALRLLAVCTQISAGTFPTPRRDAILAGLVRPKFRRGFTFFAQRALCIHGFIIANPLEASNA